MRLSDFIKQLGPTHTEAAKAFAARFGYTERAALAYLYEDRRPKPNDPRTLRLINETPVDWNGIYAVEQKSA